MNQMISVRLPQARMHNVLLDTDSATIVWHQEQFAILFQDLGFCFRFYTTYGPGAGLVDQIEHDVNTVKPSAASNTCYITVAVCYSIQDLKGLGDNCSVSEYIGNGNDFTLLFHAQTSTALRGEELSFEFLFSENKMSFNHQGTGENLESKYDSQPVNLVVGPEGGKPVDEQTEQQECGIPNISGSGCADRNPSISLREWLNNPRRVINRVESLHIFKQIAEFVELAHSQGVVLRNIRPSSFLLSSLSRISIIDSVSSNRSSSSSEESTGRAVALASSNSIKPTENDPLRSQAEHKDQEVTISARESGFHGQSASSSYPSLAVDEAEENHDEGVGRDFVGSKPDSGSGSKEIDKHAQPCLSNYCDDEQGGGFSHSSGESIPSRNVKFPLKQILDMEMIWYKSPEELDGMTPDFPCDIYSLGVLFFELFYNHESESKWSREMSDLRHRILPTKFLSEYQKEALFCLSLLHPDPSSRPKARRILHADIFAEVEDKLAERDAIMNIEEKFLEAEITLDFLLQMQREKHDVIQKLSQELQSLNNDIEEVRRWQGLLMKSRHHKRLKQKDEAHEADVWIPRFTDKGEFQDKKKETLVAKSTQVMRSFSKLRDAYLSMVSKRNLSGPLLLKGNSTRQSSEIEKPHVKKNEKLKTDNSLNSLEGFFEDLCKFMKYSRLIVKATLQYSNILNTKSLVCSLSFDCDDEFFATAGVCRKIKIFECMNVLEESNDLHYPVIEMNSRRKLSCVCWSKFHKNRLASSDLEGAIHLWDVTAGRTIMEFAEHNKCAWSVDFSHTDPMKLVSASDDCCVKLWSMTQVTSVATIKAKANVCSVQFSPHHPYLLAFGSADSQVYCHDLRYIRVPICIFSGHRKTVSFIKFADSGSIISASTDNTVKLWDLGRAKTNSRGSSSFSESRTDCIATFSGHTNLKNFVGLSVAEGGYIACGSETNEVYVYHKSFPMPMVSHKFGYADPFSGQELEDTGGQFVSSVCWRGKSQTLVAANSVGNIKVLEMV